MGKVKIFIIVFLLALLARTWGLSKYPPSLSMDEVAYGYNAYSIINTAHDEHGQFLPLAFESVGDYKPPVDVYLLAPFVKFMGLTELSVRLPVAIVSSLGVAAFALLILTLGFSSKVSLITGVWLSFLPWSVHFGRTSGGGGTSISLLIFAVLSFLHWQKNLRSGKLAFLTALFFSLSVWAYHAERFFVPILVVALFIIYFKKKWTKSMGVFLLTTLIFAIPFIKLSIFTPAIKIRAATTSILREASLVRTLHEGNYSSLEQRVFDNDTLLIFRHWAGKYLNYFDLRFWFWKGMSFTPPGYPDTGLLFAVDIPILILGIYALVKSKDRNLKALTLFWFFAGPLPASFTMNEQHPLRALTWLPFFGIVMASGFEYLTREGRKKLYIYLYLAALIVNIIYFSDIYTKQFSYHFSEYWQYGYKDVAITACQNLDKYKKVVITDTFGSLGPLNTGLPYLYVLFYCKTDRDLFLATGKHDLRFEFRRPNKEDISTPGLLLIGSPWDFLDVNVDSKIIKRVDYLNGASAFVFVKT